MNHLICPACKGKKILLHLGGMMKECGTCSGIGHVELTHAFDGKQDTKPKKRGRKPKQPILEVSNG